MSNAEYMTYELPLTVAGEFRIDRSFGYFHVVEFKDAAGVAVLDGKIELSLSVSEDDYIPLRYNNKIANRTDRARIRWTAQAGVTAVILVANDATKFAADTPNPKQLVVASGGTTLDAAAVTVGTSAVVLAASDATRQSVTIQNKGAASIFVGPSGVTTSTGIELVAAVGTITLDKQTAAIYAISGSAGNDVRVLTES